MIKNDYLIGPLCHANFQNIYSKIQKPYGISDSRGAGRSIGKIHQQYFLNENVLTFGSD